MKEHSDFQSSKFDGILMKLSINIDQISREIAEAKRNKNLHFELILTHCE